MFMLSKILLLDTTGSFDFFYNMYICKITGKPMGRFKFRQTCPTPMIL